MRKRKALAIGILAVILTVCAGFGVWSAVRSKVDPSADIRYSEGVDSGTDLIGRVTSIGSGYLSIELYTTEDADISYETLNVERLTSTGETKFVILRSDAQYFRLEQGEALSVSAQSLSVHDLIAVTLDSQGIQIILILTPHSH